MPSFLPPTSSQPSGTPRKPIDVRTLSLAQLHHFAQRGSRRAKAELERRLNAADSAAPKAAAPAPTPRRAPPTVPGGLASTPRPRPAPTVPGELGAMRPPRRTPPTVPGALTPTPKPAPAQQSADLGIGSAAAHVHDRLRDARQDADAFPSLPEPDTQPQSLPPGVDVDIGSDKAPARHFTPAPFPTTEMLGTLLPMADTSDKPFTPSYTIDVHPEDIPHVDTGEDDDTAQQLMGVSKTEYMPFPSTEVIGSNHPAPAAPPAAGAPAHKAREEHTAPEQRPSPPFLREAHTPETRLPPHLRKPRAPDSLQPSQFRESRAPDSRQPSQFRESRAAGQHPRRRKVRRPEGVPSRPVPLHVPKADAPPTPPGALDSQQERMAERMAAISRQESAQTRADDVPRFIGLVVMMWGVLVTFGGLLTKGYGLYFFASGLVIIGVGWLLFKRKRLALPVHLVALTLFLAWAWLGGKSVSAFEAIFQAAPLLVPAIWTLFPSVREPLE